MHVQAVLVGGWLDLLLACSRHQVKVVLVRGRRRGAAMLTGESGRLFRVGGFLDFASSSTRTMHPRGAYVQMGGRNRIDPRWGEIERLAVRTPFGMSGIS